MRKHALWTTSTTNTLLNINEKTYIVKYNADSWQLHNISQYPKIKNKLSQFRSGVVFKTSCQKIPEYQTNAEQVDK